MNTELKVLKKIFDEKGRAHIKSISDYVGFGRDYLRFICRRLIEKDLLISSQRDWYQLSQKGKRKLKLRGLIELRKKRLKRLKKLVSPPLKFRERGPRSGRVEGGWRPKTKSSPKIKLTSNFGSLKEKKLKLGRKIEKAAFFLEKLKG